MVDHAAMLMAAFVQVLSDDKDGYAVLRQRGTAARGYVHVVPAGRDPHVARYRHVAIELYNGTVAVTEKLREPLDAHPRPNANIETDPLGYSAGPNYGRFKWALTHDEIVRRWGNELVFARKVATLLGASDDDGDYG